MRKSMLVPVAAGLATLLGQAAVDSVVAQTRTTLDIYVVDVEGGNAMLFSAPTGESLLIDAGNVAPTLRSGTPSASWPANPAASQS